jgi:hypothetical protein
LLALAIRCCPRMRLLADTELLEMVCNKNNRDIEHLNAK